MIRLADYHVATDGEAAEPSRGKLFAYTFAGDGVYIRAVRPELDACARVSEHDVRGLPSLEPFADFKLPRVPAQILRAAFNRACSVCVGAGSPREVLFYLIFEGGLWRLVEPRQVADGGSCRPADPSDADCARAVIELHSHHEMAAFWSGQDDADETGFKLYAVMGRIFSERRLRVRAGVYGYFHEIPAEQVFELPAGVNDGEKGD